MANKELQAVISPVPREAAPYVKAGDREATSTIIFADTIIPSGSRWSVTPRKIELVVAKATPGLKWATWGEEKIGPADVESSGSVQPEAPTPVAAAPPAPAPSTADASVRATPPAYPTSSKSGPKNWEKLEVEDDEQEKDVNAFFKQLFKNSTPEQQRAMMKSFTESNGTALSTDWNDVKDRTVETVPPEGVEAKKWS